MKKIMSIELKNIQEQNLLFACLYLSFGMWRASFNVSRNGRISPNANWWRKRKIFQKARVLAVLCFCRGWIAGRSAEEIEKQVIEMGRKKPNVR